MLAVSCMLVSERLCSALAVFRATPWQAKMNSAPTLRKKAVLIGRAGEEVEKEQVQTILSFGLRRKDLSKPKYSSALLRYLLTDSPVLLYGSSKQLWERSFKCIYSGDEKDVVQTDL